MLEYMRYVMKLLNKVKNIETCDIIICGYIKEYNCFTFLHDRNY